MLERIFIQWGVGMGNIAADFQDLTVRAHVLNCEQGMLQVPYAEKKRLDNVLMDEPLLISQVPTQPVAVM